MADDPASLPDLTGKIALVDRGQITISLKAQNVKTRGAIAMILANNVEGPAPSFAQGPETGPFAPVLVVGQEVGTTLAGPIVGPETVNGSFGDVTIPLAHSMAPHSSRGPSYSFGEIKPEIAAPGQSVSAVAGTGTGEAAVGGTSTTAPMVAGSAALLLEAFPAASVIEIKSRLMNNAETMTYTDPIFAPGELAPISRAGAGEVRVDGALAAYAAAWALGERAAPALSFGHDRIARRTTIRKIIRVVNYKPEARRFELTHSFRYKDDAVSGAVSLTYPQRVRVPGNGSAEFQIRIRIDPEQLPDWTLNGGDFGGDGFRLQAHEFDGFLQIADDLDTLSLPWHVLPHKAHGLQALGDVLRVKRDKTGRVSFRNQRSVMPAQFDVFSLTGTSPMFPSSDLPGPGSDMALVDLRSVGVRLVDFGFPYGMGLQFAISTHGTRSHPNYPASFKVLIDADRDGEPDYIVVNTEAGPLAATGINRTWVLRRGDPTGRSYFATDADLNSGTAILSALFLELQPDAPERPTLPLPPMGPSTTFDFFVVALDNYFTGIVTDDIGRMTYTPDKPVFIPETYVGSVPVSNGNQEIAFFAFPENASASRSQAGLQFIFRHALPGQEAFEFQK